MDGLSLQYPNEFARLSNLINPCFTGKAKSDTTIKRVSDTVINAVTQLIPGKAGTPDTLYLPGKTIRNNIYTTVHDTIPDNRALNACNINARSAADSLLIIKTQNIQLKTDKGSLIKWLISLAVALLVLMGISIYKFVTGGVVAGTIKTLL
jgi:hypothetical protein